MNLSAVKKIESLEEEEQQHVLIKNHEDGHLLLYDKGDYKKVELKPCFPWTTPSRYLALVNSDGKELKFIDKLDELDEPSQKAVQQALYEAGFCFEVVKIDKIEEEFELRRWWVQTKQGPRQFQTKLMDWPRILPNGEMLIQDLYGDLFHIKDLKNSNLDKRGLLTAFID